MSTETLPVRCHRRPSADSLSVKRFSVDYNQKYRGKNLNGAWKNPFTPYSESSLAKLDS